MTNTEYRKAMYRNGVYTSVGNAEEEAEKRAEGWTDWYTDQDRMNGVVKPAEQVAKAALAESMRLDPHPVSREAPQAVVDAFVKLAEKVIMEEVHEGPLSSVLAQTTAKRKYTRKAK